jgi:hypothetical protein
MDCSVGRCRTPVGDIVSLYTTLSSLATLLKVLKNRGLGFNPSKLNDVGSDGLSKPTCASNAHSAQRQRETRAVCESKDEQGINVPHQHSVLTRVNSSKSTQVQGKRLC